MYFTLLSCFLCTAYLRQGSELAHDALIKVQNNNQET